MVSHKACGILFWPLAGLPQYWLEMIILIRCVGLLPPPQFSPPANQWAFYPSELYYLGLLAILGRIFCCWKHSQLTPVPYCLAIGSLGIFTLHTWGNLCLLPPHSITLPSFCCPSLLPNSSSWIWSSAKQQIPGEMQLYIENHPQAWEEIHPLSSLPKLTRRRPYVPFYISLLSPTLISSNFPDICMYRPWSGEWRRAGVIEWEN